MKSEERFEAIRNTNTPFDPEGRVDVNDFDDNSSEDKEDADERDLDTPAHETLAHDCIGEGTV